jgi:uncharacterized membrane protein
VTGGEQLVVLIVIAIFVAMISIDTVTRRDEHEARRVARNAAHERYMAEIRRHKVER